MSNAPYPHGDVLRDQRLPSPHARAAMRRVLEGPTFARSPGLSKLLRYIVEETLAGRADRLKEYTLVDCRRDSFTMADAA